MYDALDLWPSDIPQIFKSTAEGVAPNADWELNAHSNRDKVLKNSEIWFIAKKT